MSGVTVIRLIFSNSKVLFNYSWSVSSLVSFSFTTYNSDNSNTGEWYWFNNSNKGLWALFFKSSNCWSIYKQKILTGEISSDNKYSQAVSCKEMWSGWQRQMKMSIALVKFHHLYQIDLHKARERVLMTSSSSICWIVDSNRLIVLF